VPPASELREGRASWAMVAERLTPSWPRLSSPGPTAPAPQARPDAEWRQAPIPGEGRPMPPPRQADGIAQGGHEHRWAGVVVLLAGLSALLDASGQVPLARHWPLLLLGLGGLVLMRAEPEAWPLGGIPLPDSLRDPEVVRHRLAGLLLAGLAVAEWAVRLGRLRGRARFAFPLALVGGGVLLLARTHAMPGTGEALLAESPYLPLAVLALVGGVARWTELRGPEELARTARWISPAALVLAGLLLTLYPEA
jgi:copper resistance protein D